MPLPSSGAISLSQVNTELNRSATATISMDDAQVRSLFGAGGSGTAISMSQGYGKAAVFNFTISANQTNANLRTLAINAGWNQSARVNATINSGVYVSSNATGTPGLTINGSFPNGVTLTNNGFIVGMGGRGGDADGGSVNGANTGLPGSAGGLALSVSTAVTITNSGTIAGGGGGGGGGGGSWWSDGYNNFLVAGGGGGGGRSGTTNSAGGAGWQNGGAGTVSAAGAGGSGGTNPQVIRGDGGNGGGWGASGSGGGSASGPGGGGGAGGAAVSGNANITWVATGTRLGAIA